MIPVALTDEIITGTEIGKKRIDKRTSLAFVVAEIAEKIVPIAVNPRVPRKIISPSGTRKGITVVLYKIEKIKIVIISITVVNKKTPMSLATKIVQGLTGHKMRPWYVPRSRSMLKDRPSPVNPENTNATQRSPAIIPESNLSDEPKAKLKMIRIKNEN
jgi:hypothetical protein